MTRTHKTLESMIETAENKGYSKRGGWAVTLSKTPILKENGKQKEVKLPYKTIVEHIKTFTIYHWDTAIVEITQTGHFLTSYKTDLNVLYGESKSDSDGINAMIDYFGVSNPYTTFRPVNGGFIYNVKEGV